MLQVCFSRPSQQFASFVLAAACVLGVPARSEDRPAPVADKTPGSADRIENDIDVLQHTLNQMGRANDEAKRKKQKEGRYEPLEKIGRDLGDLEKELERWGVATVSSTLIVRDKGFFKNDFKQEPATYVEKARGQLQGGISQSVQSAFESRFKLRLSEMDVASDAATTVSEAAKGTSDGSSDPVSNATAADTPDAGDAPDGEGEESGAEGEDSADGEATESDEPAPSGVASVLTTPQFSAPQSLLAGQAAAIPESTALKIGFSDKLTEQLLRYLTHPQDVPTNKKVFLALLQVGVSPGTLTQRGYLADLSVTTEYGASPGKLKANRQAAQRQALCLIETQRQILRPSQRTSVCNVAISSPKDYEAAHTEARTKPTKTPKLKQHFAGWTPKELAGLASLSENLGRELSPSDTWMHLCEANAGLPELKEALKTDGSGPEEREICSAIYQLRADQYAETCPTDGPPVRSRIAEADLNQVGAPRLRFFDALRSSEMAHVCNMPAGPSSDSGSYKLSLTDGSLETAPRPTVLSVFPLLEAQIFDERSSFRHQLALAAEVAATFQASGLDIAAETMNEYVKRLENDVSTRSSRPVISPYSNATNFGYRVRPTLTATSDPRKADSGPDLVMRDVSFPALVMLVVDKKDLARYDHVVFSLDTRWHPIEQRHWFKTYLVDWWLHGQSPLFPSHSLEDQIGRAVKLDMAMDDIHELNAASLRTMTWMELRQRHLNLSDLVIGQRRYVALPEYKSPPTPKDVAPPKLKGVSPNRAWYNADTTLVITGENFKKGKSSTVKLVTVGGRPCSHTVLNATTLTCKLAKLTDAIVAPPAGFDGADVSHNHQVVVTTLGGSTQADIKRNDIVSLGFLTIGRNVEKVGVERDDAGRVTAIAVDSPGAKTKELIDGTRTKSDEGTGAKPSQKASVEFKLEAESTQPKPQKTD